MRMHQQSKIVMTQRTVFVRNKRILSIIFPKYHMKILLVYFNAKLGGEDIFKPTIGNESLHQDFNDYGFRVINFAT